MVGDIFQPTHLLFVLVVALLVLGPKRLPEVGRTLGSGIRDFRQALSGESPPQRQDSQQVTTAPPYQDPTPTDAAWPDQAVGPTSFDEPVEAASAEPATAVITDEPTDTAVVHDAVDTSDAHKDPSDFTSGEPAAEGLSFYEHALARHAAERNDSATEQTD